MGIYNREIHFTMYNLKCISLILYFILFESVQASNLSSEFILKINSDSVPKLYSLVLPISLIGYGFWTLNNSQLKSYDFKIRDKLKYTNKRVLINKYYMYTPVISVYVLNAFGVRGKHNFVDRSMVFVTAHFITINTYLQLKPLTKIQRPDGTRYSFPSGHTATAFLCAEFLHQEFKHISPIYGIAGYLIATGIAYHRIYINRHWFSDVVAGAGFGILGTKMAYWLLPIFQKALLNVKKKTGISQIAPYYENGKIGIGINIDL